MSVRQIQSTSHTLVLCFNVLLLGGKKQNILSLLFDGLKHIVVFKARSFLPAIDTGFLQFRNPK